MWNKITTPPIAALPKSSSALAVRTFRTATPLRIAIGDKLPSVDVHGKSPADSVNVQSLFAGHKKAVLFHVPGAYTPGCSKSHLPGYVERLKEFKSKGVTLVACLSVNDAFVMQAWGKSNNVDDAKDGLTVTMLADPRAEFVKAADLGFDASGPLGGVRSKRCSMFVQNGVVKSLNVEPDNTGLTCSLSENILKDL